MHAFIYKSLRKSDTYLYLREKDAFALVPEAVCAPLGDLVFVLMVELKEGRTLAHADTTVVQANLMACGYYLQLPSDTLDPLVAGGVGDG